MPWRQWGGGHPIVFPGNVVRNCPLDSFVKQSCSANDTLGYFVVVSIEISSQPCFASSGVEEGGRGKGNFRMQKGMAKVGRRIIFAGGLLVIMVWLVVGVIQQSGQ